MKKLTKILVFSILGVFLLAGTAMGITIDGEMNDWGITAWTGFSTADDVDSPVTGYSNGVYYWEEDGVGANGYVGPAYGGQDFDIEALYVTVDSGNLYVGVITGFFPDTVYYMGDIAIDLNGDGIYEYGIDTTNGQLYTVLTTDDWIPSSHTCSSPASIKGAPTGTPTGTPPDFYYGPGKLNSNPGDIYVIEAIMASASALGWSGSGNFHITQSCGNDAGDLHIPEPATMLLLGTGLLGLAVLGRKKMFKKS